MASADLKKYGSNHVKYGLAKHNYRTGTNHSNKDIDPTRTHLNRHYGAQTEEEFKEKFANMVKAADAKKPPKRKKQDRKTYLGVNIPDPREGMSAEDSARWSAKTWEVMNKLFPGQIPGATYHADEIHRYFDEYDNQYHMSRGHTHYGLLPWTDSHGLNMDAFYKRDLPNKINEALDKACLEMFGFPFRDGTGKKGKKTVEQLKKESEIAALDNQIDYAKGVLDTVKMETAEERKIAEEIYKPYVDAVERLMGQLEALKPKEREKEKDLFDWLEKNGKVMGKDLGKIRKETEIIKKQSDRIKEQYLAPVEDPEEWEYER